MPDLTVGPGDEGVRLDVLLSQRPEFGKSRSFAQRLIDSGLVCVNQKPAKAAHRTRAGDIIEFEIPPAQPMDAAPEEIPLRIIYEDSDIVVVDKERGMVVHPAAGNHRGTLVNALLAHCPDLTAIGDRIRPGIVHRLDKDTTGLLVVAKNELALRSLQEQIKSRLAKRTYLALVHGSPADSGIIEAPIGRDPKNRKRMAVVSSGRPASTRFRVLEQLGPYTLLRLDLDTGRTHQIRVHMAHIGFPVAGDPVYGPKRTVPGLTGQALHAFMLRIVHPTRKLEMEFRAPIPADFGAVLERLGAKTVRKNEPLHMV